MQRRFFVFGITALSVIVVIIVLVIGVAVARRVRTYHTANTAVPYTIPSGAPRANYDPYAGTQPATKAIGQRRTATARTDDARTRHYRTYVPAALPASGQVPLLIALHGGLGSSEQFETNSGFNGLAESNGFIVVYPDGIGALPTGGGPQTWNGGYCCGGAIRQKVDDVAFIRTLIDILTASYPIDSARIYVAGHSNGAIMAYRLACELSDRIAAIGVQAGSLGVDRCAPNAAVSVFHLHGTADTNHPIDGGKGDGIAGVSFRPARVGVETFARVDGCAAMPEYATDPTNDDVVVTTWAPCRANSMVRFVVVDGARHAWMGHPPASAAGAVYVGTSYPNLDASRAIWSFLVSQRKQ
ncbi:MAG: alpha/beta hydrolase family esterase [Acidimicrobiia bacterium]